MRIDGLTEHQVKILDELWACDTVEEMQIYMQSKSEKELQEIVNLREMIILAHVDEEIEQMGSYPEAAEMLRSIMQ